MGQLWAQSSLALRGGERAELHAVYWVANCKSTLEKFAGVDTLERAAELSVSIREEPVTARRQGCADEVPGGMVALAADAISDKKSATLKYRIN